MTNHERALIAWKVKRTEQGPNPMLVVIMVAIGCAALSGVAALAVASLQIAQM